MLWLIFEMSQEAVTMEEWGEREGLEKQFRDYRVPGMRGRSTSGEEQHLRATAGTTAGDQWESRGLSVVCLMCWAQAFGF